MKKGFTLVELLAVIVILAIIAMIAVPIIFYVIESSRVESRKRSIDMYARALETSVLNYRVANGKKILGSFTPNSDGHVLTNTSGETLNIEFNGSNVFCNTILVYEDQSIYLSDCKVGGTGNNDGVLVEDYVYGNESLIPYTYRWTTSTFYIEDSLRGAETTTDYKTLELAGYQYFLRHEIDERESIVSSDVCFISNSILYCLHGGDGGNTYTDNLAIMHRANSNCNSNSCTISGLDVYVGSDGTAMVSVHDSCCEINSVGTSYCHGSQTAAS